MYPGMMLQKLTTREPDDQQLEVAIRAFMAATEGVEESSGMEGETTNGTVGPDGRPEGGPTVAAKPGT
jgi:uncharacterized protein YqhQ